MDLKQNPTTKKTMKQISKEIAKLSKSCETTIVKVKQFLEKEKPLDDQKGV